TVALSCRRGRKGAFDGDGPGVVQLLVGVEKEWFVLDDGAADGPAVHFQIRATKNCFIGSGCARDGRIAEGVEGRVAVVVVTRAVILVRARLHVHRDDAATAVTVFRVHSVLLKREFLNGLDRRRVRSLVAGGQRHAVELNVIGAEGSATRVEFVGEGVVVGAILAVRVLAAVDGRV